MAFRDSPGISISEIDNFGYVPGVSTVNAAYVGNFRWGPIEERTQISNEAELASQFGTPDSSHAVSFLTAAQFLRYSTSLYVVRAATSAARNAVSGGTAVLIKNRSAYDDLTFSFATEGTWAARYAGTLGNSIKVSTLRVLTDEDTVLADFNAWAYKAYFDTYPLTSAAAAAVGASNDEMHVIVIDEDGEITGTPGTILERWAFLSQASDAKSSDGSSNYVKDVINNSSKYIYYLAADTTTNPNEGSALAAARDYTTTDADGVIENSLASGVESGAMDAGALATGWDLFNNKNDVSVSVLIAPDLPSGSEVAVANDIIAIAAARKDCVACVSPGADDITEATITAAFATLSSSSYAFVDTGRLKVYDKYNDTTRNIPACSSVAGCIVATERNYDAWWSPAGEVRGQIFGIDKLLYNPSETDRDALYKQGFNPIITAPGQGTFLYGDKTRLSRPSAFDRINVRRLFNVIEQSIEQAARTKLFEFNDEFTRADFVNQVEPFLRSIKGRRGIIDYRVVCNSTNNTSDVIDRNEFVADIYIKPNRSINFIQLNFIATRTGASFNEIAG